MYYAHAPRALRGIQKYPDQRFIGFGFLPFVTGTVLGLAASPFLFNRPYYPPPYPYPPYPPYGYGYGPYPYRPY